MAKTHVLLGEKKKSLGWKQKKKSLKDQILGPST